MISLRRSRTSLVCSLAVGVQDSRTSSDSALGQSDHSRAKERNARPHVLRDRAREQKYRISKHAIRRVTEAIPKPEPANARSGSSPDEEVHQNEMETNQFAKLNVMHPLIRALVAKSIFVPTPIQARTIPLAVRGRNIVASSETGSGKTLAYLLPLLHRLHIALKREQWNAARGMRSDVADGIEVEVGEEKKEQVERRPLTAPLAIIVCPSGELVEQIVEETISCGQYLSQPVKVIGLHGGIKTKSTQAKELSKGVDVVVCTPGRLLTLIKNRKVIPFEKDEIDASDGESVGSSHARETRPKSGLQIVEGGIIELSCVKAIVLDEVDKMLDMGHMADIKNLFLNLPSAKGDNPMQVMMFTATLMPKIMHLVSRFCPKNEKIDLNWDMKPPSEIHSVVYAVTPRRKHALLAYLLRRRGSLKEQKVLVFCRTGQRVLNLAESLIQDNIKAKPIHRKMSLAARQSALDSFKENDCQVLVSTELMARGMDIPDIYAVVNYDVPFVPEEYIHRIGRVGRAGRRGEAITFMSKSIETVQIANRVVEIDESEYIKRIEKLLGHRLWNGKIPGPFRDSPKFAEKRSESNCEKDKGPSPLEMKAEEARLAHLEKTHRIVDNASRMRNKHARTPREKEAARVARKKAPTLRDFEEGRYEDVVLKLDAQRLRKSGVALPSRFSDYLSQMEKKLAAKREAKNLKEKIEHPESMPRKARKEDGNGARKLAEENVS